MTRILALVLFTSVLFCNTLFGQNTFPLNGNVGVGTLSPAQTLSIRGSGSSSHILFGINASEDRARMKLFSETDYPTDFIFGNSNVSRWSLTSRNSTLNYSFGLFNYGRATYDFYINGSTGNMGIGTTNPKDKLHIKDGGDQYAGIRFTPTDGSNSNIVAGFRGKGLALAGGGSISSTYRSYIFLQDEYIQFSTRPGTTGTGGSVTERMRIMNNGDVAIGTTDPKGFKLAVNGSIRTKEVVVTADNWPDYVFSPIYNLRPLAEVESHITTHGHLPEVPNAQEVEENGVGLAEMNALLLKKIEELTLYSIEQQKEINELKKQNQRIDELEEVIKSIINR